MDFLFNFTSFLIFGSFIWFCIIVGVFIILCFLSEGYEHGGIGLGALVSLILVNYWWGNIPLIDLINWKFICSYLFIGFVFALIRTFFYARKKREIGWDEKALMRKLKGQVSRWWFMWPASLLYWIFSDLFGQVWDIVYDKIEDIFRQMVRWGLDKKP